MTVGRTIRDFLNRGEIDRIPDCFREMHYGDYLAALSNPVTLAGVVVYGDESTAIPGRVIKVF